MNAAGERNHIMAVGARATAATDEVSLVLPVSVHTRKTIAAIELATAR